MVTPEGGWEIGGGSLGDTSLSVVVQVGGGEEKIAEQIQNDLIVTEAQAIDVGLQAIYDFYYARKDYTISAPFVDLYDGDIVTIDASDLNPNPKKFRTKGVTISCTNHPRKVRLSVNAEGAYEKP